MSDSKKGKHDSPVCAITGGSSGIGLAIAQKFNQHGYRIAICGRRGSQLSAALKQIGQHQGSGSDPCIAEVIDLANVQQAVRFVDHVFHEFGRIDVWVNNAAAAPLAAFEAITAEEFENTLDINIRSVFFLTQSVWQRWVSEHPEQLRTQPTQRKQNPDLPNSVNRGRTIINISSLAAVDPFPQFSIYGASKAWMDLMTHALATEGQPHGIRVCSIRPGAVETPLLRSLFPEYPASQCASPQAVAELAWNCVNQPQIYPSGQAFTLE